MPTGLWIPPSAQIHRKTPVYLCTLCEWVGFEGEHRQYQAHVLSHTEEEVRAVSLHAQAPGLFGADAGDADWARWIRDKTESDPHGWVKWMKTDEGKHSSGLGDG